MKYTELHTLEQFEELKQGDLVVCEFHLNIHDYPKTYRLKAFEISKVRLDTKEIILKMKNNIYFNYQVYLNGESNLKHILKIEL